MKRLCDFKGDRAVEIVADLLGPISRIAANTDNKEAAGVSKIEFAKRLLKNNAADVREMMAILSEVPVEEYEVTATTVLTNVLLLLSDPELLQLFGVPSETETSAGSASANTEE